jgi:hypothetical protein
MMSNYVIAVYVSFWSSHVHGLHSVYLPKPDVTGGGVNTGWCPNNGGIDVTQFNPSMISLSHCATPRWRSGKHPQTPDFIPGLDRSSTEIPYFAVILLPVRPYAVEMLERADHTGPPCQRPTRESAWWWERLANGPRKPETRRKARWVVSGPRRRFLADQVDIIFPIFYFLFSNFYLICKFKSQSNPILSIQL